jgi:uncharacterized protein with beta-barrel porin domain
MIQFSGGRVRGSSRLKRAAYCLAAIFAVTAVTSNQASAQYLVTETYDDGLGTTAGTLSKAIADAAGGGTITLSLNMNATVLSLSASVYGISAGAPITIVGNNVTIEANGFQAFTINSGNVNLQDLNINGAVAQGQAGGNGNGGGGGGLGGGGAIYVDPAAGSISVQNVNFSNNQAVGGAGGNGTGTGNGGNGGGYNVNAGLNTHLTGTGGGAGAIGSGNGSPSGYGGGGGGGSTGATITGTGNGGGNGGLSGRGGNGGNGLGGAVFVGNGRTMTFAGGTVIAGSNTAIGGAGGTGTNGNGTAGPGSGGGLYVGIGSSAIFNNSTTDVTITGDIYSNGMLTITGTGAATVNFFGSTITTTTGIGITVATGTLNGNTGSLTGTISNSSVLRFTQATTGTFGGRIQGAGGVVVGGGATLNFTTTNTYSGGTTVEAGTVLRGNTLGIQGNIDNDSTVEFNQNFNATYGGIITGAGGLVKTGTGNLNFSAAQTYTGQTQIDAGKLSVNNTLASDVLVNSGGALGGTGTINGDVMNSGTIAPGNSIGTLHINGTFTSDAASITQIEINNTGTTPGVNNDLITVTGDAVIDGGTVSVITSTSVGFTAGSRYTFLQASNSLTGTFSGISTNTPFLNATLEYDYINRFAAFVLSRSATNYYDVAQTYNQAQLAAYLDTISQTATGDLATVLDQLNTLSASQARSAFDQMTGYVGPSATAVKMLTNNFMFQRIAINSGFEGDFGSPRDMNGQPYGATEFDDDIQFVGYQPGTAQTMPVYRLGGRNRRQHTWNAWSTGYGSFASGGNIIGDYAAAGNLTSIYRYLNDVVKFGLIGAFNYVRVGTDAPVQSSRTNDYQFGSYLRADDGETHALLAYTAGFDDINTSRNIQFAGINRVATGSTDGWQNTVYTEIGRRVPVWDFDIQPVLGLQYTYLRQNGYQETGAGGINLAAGGIDADALYGLLGARFFCDELMGNWEFHTFWLRNYLDPRNTMSSNFVGAGGAGFTTQGLDLGNDSALLGGTGSWFLTDRISLALSYDAYIANNTVFSYGAGSIQCRW